MKVLGLWSRETKLVLQRAAGGCKRPSGDTSSGLGDGQAELGVCSKDIPTLEALIPLCASDGADNRSRPTNCPGPTFQMALQVPCGSSLAPNNQGVGVVQGNPQS